MPFAILTAVPLNCFINGITIIIFYLIFLFTKAKVLFTKAKMIIFVSTFNNLVKKNRATLNKKQIEDKDLLFGLL